MADSCHLGVGCFSCCYDVIDISCHKILFWGLNALILHMKQDEGLYDKLLRSLFTLWAYFRFWWTTFQINKFLCHWPSFCIHFEVCQFSTGKRIWSIWTFETHSLVRNSHKNYSNIVYFRSYQRISVSIGINAKCGSFTVMRMTADGLFSIVHRACLFLSFCVMFVCKNCLLRCAKYQRQTYILENWKYSAMAFCILRSSKTKSSELQ